MDPFLCATSFTDLGNYDVHFECVHWHTICNKAISIKCQGKTHKKYRRWRKEVDRWVGMKADQV